VSRFSKWYKRLQQRESQLLCIRNMAAPLIPRTLTERVEPVRELLEGPPIPRQPAEYERAANTVGRGVHRRRHDQYQGNGPFSEVMLSLK
jgi:hypothetical protein